MTQTNQEFLLQFQRVIIDSLTESRTRAKIVSKKAVAQAYFNAKIEILERLSVFIHKSIQQGDIDMTAMKAEIAAGDKIKLDEIATRTRGGKIEPKIIEIAETLKIGEAVPIDPDTITWAHFSGRVYSMKKKGLLPEEYAPVKRGDKFFLGRYPKEKFTSKAK